MLLKSILTILYWYYKNDFCKWWKTAYTYKIAIFISSIAWPFICLAHRSFSFHCKSPIWWRWPLSMSNSENWRVKFKWKKKFTKRTWISLWFSSALLWNSISMLCRNWLEIENCFPPYFKQGWKDFSGRKFLFLEDYTFCPLPVRSTAGRPVKWQNRMPIPSPLIGVCTSICSTPVPLLHLSPGKSNKPFLLSSQETEIRANPMTAHFILSWGKAHRGEPQPCRRVGAHMLHGPKPSAPGKLPMKFWY